MEQLDVAASPPSRRISKRHDEIWTEIRTLRQDVPYRFYDATPPVSVPHEVWQYIADDHENVACEQLDVSPDGTACLRWEEETPSVKRFKLLCMQGCKRLWTMRTCLLTVARSHFVG